MEPTTASISPAGPLPVEAPATGATIGAVPSLDAAQVAELAADARAAQPRAPRCSAPPSGG
jgi:acyl-CoA reductase-like NAD-dependent aldehyde dehydrogenase